MPSTNQASWIHRGRCVLLLGLWLAVPVGVELHRKGFADDLGAQDGWAVPLVGERFRGRLTEIDPQWMMTLENAGARRQVHCSQLARWGAYHEARGATQIILRDGGILVAEVVELTESSVTVESAGWPATRIDRPLVAGLVFSPPGRTADYDRLLDTIREGGQTNDLVLLHNGDRLDGQLMATTGVDPARSSTPLRRFDVELSRGQQPITVGVDDMVAVLFRKTRQQATEGGSPQAWLGFRDGSLLTVAAIDAEGPNVVWTTACGQRLALPADLAWQEVQLVHPLGGTSRYLSDRTPRGYQHSPYLELKRDLGRDRNVLGRRLRCGGYLHLKGLGMATTSRVIYDVTPADRRLAAELAIDDAAQSGGSAVFRVFQETRSADGRTTWASAYVSPVIRGGMLPVPISLELRGVQRIALIVDFADRGDARDYANWLNARFLPE